MRNRDTEAAWEYHNGTKHSVESVQASRHYLNWSSLPRPYKLYPDLQALPLPQEYLSSSIPALQALSTESIPRDRERIPDLKTLATILHFSAGITK